MIKIEPATEQNLYEVAQIEQELFSKPWSRQAFIETLSLDHVIFLVAKKEQEVIGYSICYQSLDEAEITNVAIKATEQKNGIGYKLMEMVKKKAEERNVRCLFLEVRVSNQPAIHLYEKTGFKIVGTRKNFYEKPLEDAYIMKYEATGH